MRRVLWLDLGGWRESIGFNRSPAAGSDGIGVGIANRLFFWLRLLILGGRRNCGWWSNCWRSWEWRFVSIGICRRCVGTVAHDHGAEYAQPDSSKSTVHHALPHRNIRGIVACARQAQRRFCRARDRAPDRREVTDRSGPRARRSKQSAPVSEQQRRTACEQRNEPWGTHLHTMFDADAIDHGDLALRTSRAIRVASRHSRAPSQRSCPRSTTTPATGSSRQRYCVASCCPSSLSSFRNDDGPNTVTLPRHEATQALTSNDSWHVNARSTPPSGRRRTFCVGCHCRSRMNGATFAENRSRYFNCTPVPWTPNSDATYRCGSKLDGGSARCSVTTRWRTRCNARVITTSRRR